MTSTVRGLPGPRRLLPSYLRATSSRYHLRMVSGVTMQASSPSAFRPTRPALDRQPTALGVGQAQAPATELLAEDTVLLHEIGHRRFLAAREPARNHQDQELERRAAHGGRSIPARRAKTTRWAIRATARLDS